MICRFLGSVLLFSVCCSAAQASEYVLVHEKFNEFELTQAGTGSGLSSAEMSLSVAQLLADQLDPAFPWVQQEIDLIAAEIESVENEMQRLDQSASHAYLRFWNNPNPVTANWSIQSSEWSTTQMNWLSDDVEDIHDDITDLIAEIDALLSGQGQGGYGP